MENRLIEKVDTTSKNPVLNQVFTSFIVSLSKSNLFEDEELAEVIKILSEGIKGKKDDILYIISNNKKEISQK